MGNTDCNNCSKVLGYFSCFIIFLQGDRIIVAQKLLIEESRLINRNTLDQCFPNSGQQNSLTIMYFKVNV